MAQSRSDDLKERSLPELMAQLTSEISTLIRQELELAKASVRQDVEEVRASVTGDIAVAKAELTEKGKHAGRGGGMFAGAAVAAVLTLGAASAFLFLILNAWMRDWLAALIVALLWAVVGYVLVQRGRAELREMGAPLPEQAIEQLRMHTQRAIEDIKDDAAESAESIKEDVQWAKTPSGSGRT